VRVTTELFQAADQQVWAEAHERTMREILVLQRDIVRGSPRVCGWR
jgi:TolB-like protein